MRRKVYIIGKSTKRMRWKFLLLTFSIVFLFNFVTAADTIATNASLVNSGTHDLNSVNGVLFVPEVNKTLVSITRNSTDTAPFCIVLDGKTNATIVNSTWTNDVCDGGNVSLTAGNLYRIGTGANSTNYNYIYGNYNPAFYSGIGNFTGGCFGADCATAYTIASTMYSIQSITLGDPTPAPPTFENLTVENLTARLIYTQNFSTEGVTKNMTFFSEFALIFRSITQRIWSPSAGTLKADASSLILLDTPTVNATNNVTVGKLLKLNAGALPTCNSVTNGSFAINTTGMLVFCNNGTRWRRVSLTN